MGSEADRKLTAEEKKELVAVLKEDPRPAYQDDPDREYVFGFAGKQVHFRVAEEILTVNEVEISENELEKFKKDNY